MKFVDLQAQYHTIKSEILAAIQDVLDSGIYVQGPCVESFEANFAAFHQTKYCVATSSGTAALHLAMWALGLRAGDEVLVPTNTFIATANAVSFTGAKPVFVDCDPDFYNISCEQAESLITPRTKAIIAVHLYGQPAPLARLKELTTKNNILLIEDCAQAHLATYNGIPVGGFGIAGCFSFYPSKNLGACGEGGAVLTNDATLYEQMKILREHGAHHKYEHESIGQNYRLHAMQAAILDVKLKYLKQWNSARKQIAQWYNEGLKKISQVHIPKVMEGADHVYHLYVIRTERRNALMSFLEEKGIPTGIHYPIPCHLQKAYSHLLIPTNSFPIAEKYADELLSLPLYPELGKPEVEYVCQMIREYF